MSSRGLFVPISKDKEWLIHWWWLNYTLNCALPLTFIKESQLSPRCEKWCKERSSHEEFDETLWLEPWCQIRGSLDPLYLKANCEANFALSPKSFDVIAFKKDSSLAKNWDEKEEFIENSKLRFNQFSTFEVDEPSDENQFAKVFNWGSQLDALKEYIDIVEKQYLINLSFKEGD